MSFFCLLIATLIVLNSIVGRIYNSSVSIEIVKAVCILDLFVETSNSIYQYGLVNAKQIKPLPCFAIKYTLRITLRSGNY